MKRKIIPFAAATAALVLSMSVEPVSAYFTDHHTANGSVPVRVEPTTVIHEKFGDRKKTFTITNTGQEGDPAVFMRLKVFSSDRSYTVESAGDGWTTTPDEDGWYYFNKPVAPGAAADDISVTLNFPEGATEEDEYNVAVVYEATPATFNADGTPAPDWSSKELDRITTTQNNQS